MAQFEREFDVAVSWWPYELHPETPPEGRSVDDLLRRSGRANDAYRETLKAYAKEAGITLASNRWLSNSHRALELAEFARDRGKFDEVHMALFVAYFEQARDIGDIDVLMEIAAEHDLDPDEFGIEILNGRYAALIDRTTAIAHERGFTSTPTMIFNDQVMIPGAQDYNVYESVLGRLGARRRDSG